MKDDMYGIVVRPLVTEKGTFQSEALNAYSFQGAPKANKKWVSSPI